MNNKLADERVNHYAENGFDCGYNRRDIQAMAVELQELRRNYLALRGEIEDVRSQLYEAENQANEYASELQERRKADSTVFMYGIVTPDGDAYMEEFCVSNDLGLMEDEASALNDTFDTDGYRAVALYTASPAPTAPLVPEPATVETTYPDVQTNWQDAKMYAEGWNACRTAMLATAQ
ncbi:MULTISPECIES: hypothetical protein [Citrobacter]|jgi:hypothetical protein|uniref:hypothetical protein n=1 Tax=Citrobacter TaxID=544 RepID=UPI00257782DF|nr:hypothetical protein [Citrobacter sp. Ce104]MDM3280892.1 hypothetical protein [Citrobacter sp. Ce104]